MKVTTTEKLIIGVAGLVIIGGLSYYAWTRTPAAKAAAAPYDSKAPEATQAAVKPATPAEVIPAKPTQTEAVQFTQMETLQKKEVAELKLKSPQKVGNHTNWKGENAEVWLYPTENKYGVIVPANHKLDTGPKYDTLTDAAAYARGVVGVR